MYFQPPQVVGEGAEAGEAEERPGPWARGRRRACLGGRLGGRDAELLQDVGSGLSEKLEGTARALQL